MATRSHVRACWWAYAGLMTLLALTVAATYVPLGAASTAVPLAIASLKTLLVALVFMGLARKSGVARLFAIGGVAWLAVFLALTATDYATRHGPSTSAWNDDATPPGLPSPSPETRATDR